LTNETKHLTDEDQYIKGYALTETHVFERICMFSFDDSQRAAQTLWRSTGFSSVGDSTILVCTVPHLRRLGCSSFLL